MRSHSPAAPETAFKTVANDPIQVRQYTLSNGLRLFMSVNKDEPRIHTEIAVRAGSKHDPAETTGLAHYFEHMMFKGTDRFGSLNWEKEKPLLDEIERLFEVHRAEQDPQKKKELYAQIDRLSFEAAKYAASNEYDKMVSAMGAKNTNAYTWVEQTVYVNDIPSNELQRWFELESERFRRPILRLFHTELETVFEEYNISQDRDFRKTMREMQAVLTPTHPYGTQTTLGRGDDLKNPSQTNIYRFFDQYYVPNNMGIILSGDFDPAEAVQWAERYFGGFTQKAFPPFKYEPQPNLSSRVRRDVYGAESPWIEMAWRFPGAGSSEAALLPLIAGILHNQQAGIFDLNLVQSQKVLEVYAFPRTYQDYANLQIYAKPRDGQTLEQLEQLILEEIDKLRQGHFEAWLPTAVIKDLKLSEIKQFEKNQGRASAITNAYVLGLDWNDMVGRWKKLSKVGKNDVMLFSQKYLRDDNFVVAYKHTGVDQSVMKVEKPPITPIEVNRADLSEYAQQFLEKEIPEIEPVFLDFEKLIKNVNLTKGVKLRHVLRAKHPIFRVDFCFDLGKTADRRLGILADYLQYLGTSQYSPQAMQQQFYRLGVNYFATCREDHFFISLSGLSESFEEALDLLEHLLTDAQPNPDALSNLVADILVRRENAKSDKQQILRKAMASYGKYGVNSPYRYRLNQTELQSLQPAELISMLNEVLRYPHEIAYNGPHGARKVAKLLRREHIDQPRVVLPKGVVFKEIPAKTDKVFFVHFPMVQVELLLMSKGTSKFDLDEYIWAEWFNQYFGYGLSSIVFQEIRESKALAYSAYAYAASPEKRNKPHFLQAYVGTQPDKLHEAIEAFKQLLAEMPVSPPQMEQARQSVIRQIAASRIAPQDWYWHWRTQRDRGLRTDLRKAVYERLHAALPADLIRYHREKVSGKSFHWLVLGDKTAIDFKHLRKIGKVVELSLEEVFGY